MIRLLQGKSRPVEYVTASADMVTGTVVTKAGKTVAVAVDGTGDYLADAQKTYTGLNAVVNPTDAASTVIASGAMCVSVPAYLGDRFASSEVTRNYADKGDPMVVSNGKFVKAASANAYQWVYGGEYQDPAGTLHIVERVPTGVAPNTRTMSYDNNSGTGTMADARSPYFVGKKITVLPCTFTAPTYKDFTKWNTAAAGTGTDYDPGDEITVAAANIKLYALYADSHTLLTLDANGGTGTMSVTDKFYEGEKITVPENAFTPASGKKFSKWNTAAAGTGTDYNPGDEIEVTNAMIGAATPLYAIWVNT